MTHSSNEADKAKGRAAVGSYIVKYGPDVSIVDCRSYVRSETGIYFGGPTIAAFLRSLGYAREGERKIDTCPGKSVFYVPVS